MEHLIDPRYGGQGEPEGTLSDFIVDSDEDSDEDQSNVDDVSTDDDDDVDDDDERGPAKAGSAYIESSGDEAELHLGSQPGSSDDGPDDGFAPKYALFRSAYYLGSFKTLPMPDRKTETSTPVSVTAHRD